MSSDSKSTHEISGFCSRLRGGAYLNGLVQGAGGERVRVLWIQSDPHDIISVALEGSHLFPSLFPVPGFDAQVVRAGKEEGAGRMDDEAADVVRMGGELGHTLEGVEIEDTEH